MHYEDEILSGQSPSSDEYLEIPCAFEKFVSIAFSLWKLFFEGRFPRRPRATTAQACRK
jgi:hypothetical protein